MPPIEPELEHQKIRDRGLLEDLDLEPESPRTFWTNNIFTRTISRLVGKAVSGYKHIKATEFGALLVANVGGGTTYYTTYPKFTFTDNNYKIINWTMPRSRIDITTWGFDVKIQLSNDGINYGADIVINANTFYSIEHTIVKMKVANNTAGSNATMQLVAFR